MAGVKIRIGHNGRLVNPADYLGALRVKTGVQVVLLLREGEFRMLTRGAAIKEAQALRAELRP